MSWNFFEGQEMHRAGCVRSAAARPQWFFRAMDYHLMHRTLQDAYMCLMAGGCMGARG